MFRKLLLGAALSICVAAQASEKTFEIVYQGAYSPVFEVFLPDWKLTVEITVNDLNNDGSYSQGELSRLKVDELEYRGSCSAVDCVENFNWTTGSLPEFTATYRRQTYWGGDLMYEQRNTLVAGVDYHLYAWSYTSGIVSDFTWQWTDATATTVTDISPVPEPAQYGMFAAGIAGIAALARRRHA